jgi:hypothetical protein
LSWPARSASAFQFGFGCGKLELMSACAFSTSGVSGAFTSARAWAVAPAGIAITLASVDSVSAADVDYFETR